MSVPAEHSAQGLGRCPFRPRRNRHVAVTAFSEIYKKCALCVAPMPIVDFTKLF
jgi:hypothetical protein